MHRASVPIRPLQADFPASLLAVDDSQVSHAARAFTKALASEIGTLLAGGRQCWVPTISGSTISCLLNVYSLGRNNNHSIHCIYIFLDFIFVTRLFLFALHIRDQDIYGLVLKDH